MKIAIVERGGSKWVLGVLLALGMGSAWADDANLAGTWNLSIQSPQGTRTPTMTLTQEGSSVSGTYKSLKREGPVSGKVTGSDFLLDVKLTADGQEFTLAYKGTLVGNAMKGSVSMGKMGDAIFTGARATP